MPRRRKRKILFPVLLLIFTLLLPGSVFAISGTAAVTGTKSSLTMKVTYGYDDCAKGGRILPVTVSCTNTGDSAFSGTVRILTQGSDGNILEYDYDVSVPAGQTSSNRSYIPIGINSDQIYVRITDPSGTGVADQRIKLNVSTGTPELFIGVLSDYPDKLKYLNDVSVNYAQLKTKVFNLDQSTFPEEDSGLDLLDVILISSYRIRNLNVLQTRALMQWVRNGGILILGTGDRVNDTIGRFAPELLEDSYEDPEPAQIDMSSSMDTDIPGDNTITIPCVSISLHGGNVIIPGSKGALISSVNKGNGMITVAAFDFTDISDYANRHNSYVNAMLTRILGSTRMNRISSEAYGTDTGDYLSAQSLINTGESTRLPDMSLYIIVILIYILLAGPILYLFLQKQASGTGRGFIYRRSVLVISAVFTSVIYFLGSRTRFHGTFYSYATILDSGEDSVSETTYLNIRNPYNTAYQVDIKPSYALLPVTESGTAAKSPQTLTGNETANISVSQEKAGTKISVRNVGAFNSEFFQLKKNSDNLDGSGFAGDISLFENEFSGTVTNNYPYPVSDAAIVFFGKIIPLGHMDPGESRDISNGKVLNIPLNSSFATASRITGLDSETASGKNGDSSYMATLERTNLLSFYFDRNMSGYTADAKMIAFPDSAENSSAVENSDLESSGVTLLTSTLSVNSRQDDKIYRSALLKTPNVLSGDYISATNSAYTGEPVVLEYSLGNDISVDHLNFETVDPEFFSPDARTRVNGFRGTVSIYNYSTGNYDDFDISKVRFSAKELSDYISPGNTISIRYAETGKGNDSAQIDTELPMLTLVGKET